MDPSTWKKIEGILDVILELPKAKRIEYINTQVKDDEIRLEILQLLDAENFVPEFLDSDVSQLLESTEDINEIAEKMQGYGPELDRYKIIREIGRGGMSLVYEAHRTDGEFQQKTAVKIIQPFGLNREEQFQRLKAERQILANLQHSNIARVYDGGVTPEGWPYMVMELVKGIPVTRYCKDNKLGLEERLKLFCTICDAVNYAHQNLVLHRDLKPGNILITKDGQVKLLDFGIAKLLTDEQSSAPLTQTGRPLLTPEYAAPEQFRGKKTSTALDVYSLGVLLYELLAGVRPFDLSEKNFPEIEQIITHDEPQKPSEKASLRTIPAAALLGDLDVICLKALMKEPENRYGSVQDLKEDINRFLTGIPISARPATKRYRIKKFTQRHRTGITAAASFLVVLSGFIALLINQQAITAQERDRAVTFSEQLQSELDRSNTLRSFLVEMFRANIPDRPQDELPTTEQLLEAGVERALDPESGDPSIRADMLTVIASIYEPQNRLERALDLTDQAIKLVEGDTLKYRDQLVSAWRLHSQISLRQRNIDLAEESLLKSYQLMLPERMTSDNELRLALDIARIRMLNGEYEQAENLLQPYVDNVLNGVEYSPRHINRLLWDMGIVYGLRNDFEKSLEARLALNNNSKILHGPTSLNYAVSIANTASTQVQLGLFSDAEEKLAEVLDLYSAIFEDQPSEYRAAALHTLARLRRYSGNFDQALNTARLSSEQWAAATERENLDEYVWFHFGQAEILVESEQWDEAKPVLDHARMLFSELDPPQSGRLSWAEANLALIHCKNDEINSGMELIDIVNKRVDSAETEFMHTDDKLAFHRAEGVCAFEDGRFEDAVSSFSQALDLPIPPGQFATTARLHIYLAKTSAKLGQFEFSMQKLQDAENILLQHAGIYHPNIKLLEEMLLDLQETKLTP